MAVCMASHSSPSLIELLSDGRWLRQMAHRLARSSDEGDDLAQSACLKALQAPPQDGESLRGWFVQVVRNLRGERHRRDARRVAREQLVAGGHTEESASELVERAAVQRSVLDAVLALQEPYRATVLLRFFEELPPRDIATRMGVPVATVHTRLQRAFVQLRRRLDTQFGDRKAWAMVLLSLPDWQTATTPTWILFMQAKTLASLAVVSIGVFLLWWATTPAELAPSGAPAMSAVADATLASKAQPALRAMGTERIRVADSPPTPTPAATAMPLLRELRGRVVDSDGNVLPSFALAFEPDHLEVDSGVAASEFVSEPDGSFQFATARMGSGVVKVQHPGWRTVCCAAVGTGVPSPMYLVVAARSLAVAGRVLGEDGRVIDNATVRVVWPKDLRARLTDISDRAETERLVRRCDPSGRFELLAAGVRGAELLTSAPGFLPDRRALPQQTEQAIEIRLREPAREHGILRGAVVDVRGRPVANATVTLGANATVADAGGEFVLSDDGSGDTMFASMVGWRMARQQRLATGFPAFCMLTLGPRALAIEGVVHDEQGRGVPNIKVWVTDPTIIGHGASLMTGEGVACGCASMAELRERSSLGESISRETPMSHWSWVATDAQGRFRLNGLEDRPYNLRAMAAVTLQCVDLAAVTPGDAEVLLRMRSSDRFAALRGRVVNRFGVGIANARIRVQVDAQRVGGTTMDVSAAQATAADASGHFQLRNVPHHSVYLRVDGEGILPVTYGRHCDGGLVSLLDSASGSMRIVAKERLHVQVALIAPETADSLQVLDAQDKPLMLNLFKGRSRHETRTITIAGGKSPVFVATDDGLTLRLMRNGREVARQALVLQSGTVNRVQL